MPYIKTDRASLLDARSVLYDNPLLLLIPLVSFHKLYKTSHELSIVLSFFVVFFAQTLQPPCRIGRAGGGQHRGFYAGQGQLIFSIKLSCFVTVGIDPRDL